MCSSCLKAAMAGHPCVPWHCAWVGCGSTLRVQQRLVALEPRVGTAGAVRVSQPGEARSSCPWQMLCFVQVVSPLVNTIADFFILY